MLRLLVSLLLLANAAGAQAQQILRGLVVEKDTITPLPFVYLINKSNGNGTMADNDGHFMLSTRESDTIVCSAVGFLRLYMPVKQLHKNAKGEVLLIMTPMPINLAPVTISTFKYKPYERQYMNDIIDRSKIKTMSYFSSPISALYMRYSKEGKQINKLAKIFEKLLIEEEVQKKLNKEILIRLTGDEKIDYDTFRRYCYYVSDNYILTHDGMELYTKVMDCYRRWKMERGQ